MHLVIIDRGEVKALVPHDADVVQKLLARDDTVLDAAVALPVGGEEGVKAGVGETVGIDFVDEHALFPGGKEQAHGGDHDQRQRQRPAAFESILHGTSSLRKTI